MAQVTNTFRRGYEEQILRDLERVPKAGAEAFALKLYEKLDSESHGRGIQYPRLRNRSSTPTQLPVRQTGSFRDSADYRQVSRFRWAAGIFPEARDVAKARSLEYGSENMEQRAPTRRVGADSYTKRAMAQAVADLF